MQADLNIQVAELECGYYAYAGGKAFRVSPSIYSVLTALGRGSTLRAAVEDEAHARGLNDEEKLLLQGQVESLLAKGASPKKRRSYIWPQITLAKGRLLTRILAPITHLFRSGWALGLLLSIIPTAFFLLSKWHGNALHLSIADLWIVFLLSNIFVFIHELGHAAALQREVKIPQKIGFGLYYGFIPVFFSDVTFSWLLPRAKRIRVALGGIYLQLLINAILVAILSITPHPVVQSYCVRLIQANIFVIVLSIIPFFRSDGYWVLTDLLRAEHLMRTADTWPMRLFSSTIRRKFPRERPLIGLYSLCSWAFRIYLGYRLLSFEVHLLTATASGEFLGVLPYLSGILAGVGLYAIGKQCVGIVFSCIKSEGYAAFAAHAA